MKKFLMGTVGLVALGIAAPASAADMAARPYTKAPPMIAAMYDWSGFYIGVNGGGAGAASAGTSSRPLGVYFAGSPKAAMMQPAARSAVRLVIAGRPAPGCSVWKHRATGPIFRGSQRQPRSPASSPTAPSRRARPVHRPSRLRLEQRPALRKGRRGGHRQPYDGLITATGVCFDRASDTRWGGVVGVGLEYGFTPNWSVAVEYDHLFMGRRNLNFTCRVVPRRVLA